MSDHAEEDAETTTSATRRQDSSSSSHHQHQYHHSHNRYSSSPQYYDDCNDSDDLPSSLLLFRSPTQRLTRRTTQARIDMPVKSSAYLCGLLAGVAQAGVFNPYDRALYLSVKEKRKFLAWQNWKAPYNGFFQTIGGRALSGGLYFPLEHYFLHLIRPHDPHQHNHHHHDTSSSSDTMSASYSPQHFIAGTAAGAANAIVLNPLSAIKYKVWGRETNQGMWAEAVGMLHKAGGLRPFWNGLLPTLYRDVVFGGCYTYLRFRLLRTGWLDQQWQANVLAAALATIASGPFNYVRNIQYGTRSHERALSTYMILQDLWWEVSQETKWHRKLHLLQLRLRIGWGTARVALGMSLGHTVYDILQDQITTRTKLFF